MPNGRKRTRATVIAKKDGRVLLIRERGSKSFSLPAGGIEGHESTMEAALRELREETRLRPVAAERLFNHEVTTQFHKIVRVKARGKVTLQRKEVSEYKWWNGSDPVSVLPSTRAILEQAGEISPSPRSRPARATTPVPTISPTTSFNGH